MTERDPRLYIDCTSTFRSGLNTGVQRVVRSLIAEAATFSDITQLDCIPVCYQFNGFYTLEDAGKITLETLDDFEPVDFCFRDVYLCPDAFWTAGMTTWFDYFRDHGVTIATVIYDLIPIVNPEFCDALAIEEFESALLEVVRKSDLLFTISESTRQDLITYCLAKDEPLIKDNCKVIPLAPALPIGTEEVDPHRLPKAPFFLMVGTVEPRRGYIEAVAEYQAYLASGGESSLLIIGKEGGAAETVNQCIRNAGNKVIWLTDANDAELLAAYRKALAVVCPSRSEGYGMSVSEGLAYNGLVLANRLPVFGEFAGSRPYYFDIDRQGDLARLLTASPDLKRLAHSPDMGSWQATAKVLATELIAISSVHGRHQAIEITRNSEEAVRWAYWLIFGRVCDSDEVANWLKFDTVQDMFEGLRYEQRLSEAPLNADSVRWLQLAINGKQEVGDEEVAAWCNLCSSVGELRHTLLAEHYRLEASLNADSVSWLQLIINGREGVSDDEIAYWCDISDSVGELRRTLMAEHYLPDAPLNADSVRWLQLVINAREGVDDKEVDYWCGRCKSVDELRRVLMAEHYQPNAELSADSVRWIQLAINGRSGVNDEEVAYWCGRCHSNIELRSTLIAEHYRLDAPLTELFVRCALVTLLGQTDADPEKIASWLQEGGTNGDFLAKLRLQNSNKN